MLVECIEIRDELHKDSSKKELECSRVKLEHIEALLESCSEEV